MKISESELSAAVRLLRKNSSINAVSSFLKRRNLVSSATSWDGLLDLRIKPSLQSGALDRGDIVQLIRESEEYGRQHVFLFRCSKSEALSLNNESVIRSRLADLDLGNLLSNPRIIDTPRGLQLVDVRLEGLGNERSLIVKGIGVRRRRVHIGTEKSGNREIVTYEWEEDRCVNVLRVSTQGLVEVRIQSYRNAVDYAAEAEELFAKCTGIVDRLKFEDFSLARARLHLIQKRNSLSDFVRFAENTLRSKMGGKSGSQLGIPRRTCSTTMRSLTAALIAS
jgi:hypothetical protein